MAENVIELLQAMIHVDTVADALVGRECSEQPLVESLDTLAQTWGFSTRRLPVPEYADQLLITHEAGTDRPWLLFDSHLDTVGTAGMTIDPFGGELRDGRVYGRGACDTKGTGAAMLWALRQHVEQSDQPNNIALLFSVDEEAGMAGIRQFVTHDLPRLDWSPVGGVVGEPTTSLPIAAHLGLVRWSLTTRGTAAHSSMPQLGRSAITPMIQLVQAIEDEYVPAVTASHPLCGPAACSVTMIHAGQSPNIIPDRCEVSIDRRLAPQETPASVTQALMAVLDATGIDYALETRMTHTPLGDDLNPALTEATLEVLKQMGQPGQKLGAPFCTHASYLSAAGLATIVLGPGDPMMAHKPDEYIATEELERGVEVYLGLMRSTRLT